MSQLYSDMQSEGMQNIEKTANKDRQFFQQGEKVKVFHCAAVSPSSPSHRI